MKAIYLSAALVFFTVSVIAQNNPLDLKDLPGLEKNTVIKWNELFNIQALSSPKYGIIKLPQDNMPCLVPDVSSIAYMPTLKIDLPYQFIPNPYFKYSMPPVRTPGALPR